MLKVIRKFLRHGDKNIEQSGVLWNTLTGIMNAAQSAVIMMVLMRTNGVVESGIFTLAFSFANLMLYLGKYGTRNYQVTDYNKKFSFSAYLVHRLSSSFLMIFISVIYCVYGVLALDYSVRKALIVLFMCLFKVVDSVGDVFLGMYQQNNRLDIAARLNASRTFLTTLLLIIVLIVTKDILIATIVATLFTGVIVTLMNLSVVGDFEKIKKDFTLKQILLIYKICFPLFIYGFSTIYLTNAPKYAIDAQLDEESQAMFGIISMFVFVVNLFSQFVFQPILASLGKDREEGNFKRILFCIIRQFLIIILITGLILIGGYFVGIPILNLLYDTDISAYKFEFLVLIIGGGLQAVSTLFTSALTVIRFQQPITLIYVAGSVVAFFAYNNIVGQFGVKGASVGFTALAGAISFLLFIVFLIRISIISKQKKK